MATPSILGLTRTYEDLTTDFSGDTAAFMAGALDNALAAMNAGARGVIDSGSGGDFAVTAGTGLSVNIAAAPLGGIASHPDYGSIWYRTTSTLTAAIPASSTVYLFAIPNELPGQTTPETHLPSFATSSQPTYPGALRLALIKTSGSAVTVVRDYRSFINPNGDAFAGQFAEDTDTTSGLVLAFNGGSIRKSDGSVVVLPASTITLTASANQYVEKDEDGVLYKHTSGFTGAPYLPLWYGITDTDSIATAVSQRDRRISLDFAAGSAGTEVEDASTTTKGIVKLSTAPADAAQPIAVGTNDSRMTDARTPTGTAGGVLSGSWPNPSFAVDMATQAELNTHTSATAPHTGHFDKDGSKALTGDADAGGHKWTNAADPTNPTDLVTKQYTDALASGLSPKANVKAATTANITLSGAQTIDAVSVIAGDRVLVKDQTTQSENGLYDVGTPWVRAGDANTAGEMPTGTSVTVLNGSANKNKKFIITTAATVLDTDPIVWGLDSVSAGEVNTLASAATDPDAVSIVDAKAGTVLNNYGIASKSDALGVNRNTSTKTVEVTFIPSEVSPNDLTGIGDIAHGGTGLNSYTAGDMLYASADDVLAVIPGNLDATDEVLTMNGGVPTWKVVTVRDYTATSTSSLLISLGAKTLVLAESNRAYAFGTRIRVVSQADATKFLEGVVTSYSGTTLVFTADLIGGSGTLSSWNVGLAGQPGSTAGADGSGYLSLDVSGSSDVTLTTSQASMGNITFNGTLTADINVIVPINIRSLFVYNGTSGAHNITVKTPSGAGTVLVPGAKNWLYVDGTDVVGNMQLPDIVSDPAITGRKLYNVGGLLKWAGKYLAQIATTLGNSQVVETNGSGFLVSAAKGSAYNKDFGTTTGTVADGGVVATNTANIATNTSAIATNTSDIAGKVTGPASATDNGLLAFDGTTGKLVKARTLTATDIPSLDAAKITTGTLGIARLATGTPDGTKFVRDDGVLASPAVGGDLSGTLATAVVTKINGITVTGTPSVGYVPTATSGTAATWQAQSGGSAYVGCVASRSAVQTTSTGVDTFVAWTSELWDTDAFHDNTTNNTRLTVPTGKGGRYRIEATIVWASGVTSGKFGLFLYKNGTQISYQNIDPGSAAMKVTNYILYFDNSVAGDYYEVLVNQSSLANNDITTTSQFSIQKL